MMKSEYIEVKDSKYTIIFVHGIIGSPVRFNDLYPLISNNFSYIKVVLDGHGKKAKDFSLGMRQRLALAIALLGNPEFLVLDEPINGLDPTGIIELRNLLKRLNEERGITILISSHILSELHQLANRYGILHEGKLLQEITAAELEQRCKKHLLLQVNDVATTSALLESELNTSNFSVMPDKSIHLYDYVENAGKVSALLSANNITIYQLAQSGDSLETYYTNLIGGCQND